MTANSSKTVYLMRGLPSCGKSYTARKLAGDTGVVLETDEYFYTQVGSDPDRYDYDAAMLPKARQWNFERFKKAIDADVSPIIVDRGNGRNRETQQYARYAVEHGYEVQLKEPESPWWQEIRDLLKDKNANRAQLYLWANELSQRSRATHRVPTDTIRHWMEQWKCDLTVEEILNV